VPLLPVRELAVRRLRGATCGKAQSETGTGRNREGKRSGGVPWWSWRADDLKASGESVRRKSTSCGATPSSSSSSSAEGAAGLLGPSPLLLRRNGHVKEAKAMEQVRCDANRRRRRRRRRRSDWAPKEQGFVTSSASLSETKRKNKRREDERMQNILLDPLGRLCFPSPTTRIAASSYDRGVGCETLVPPRKSRSSRSGL
jgi:hypothetical protein